MHIMKTFFTILIFLSPISLLAQNDTLSIFFDVNSYTIRQSDIIKLNGLKEKIQNNKLSLVEFNGFADTSGSEQFNRVLSSKRIESVINELEINQKVKTNTIGESYTLPERGYNPDHFRRVDVIYKNLSVATQTEIPSIVKESTLIADLTDFLVDPNQKEITLALSINFVPGEDVILAESEKELSELLSFLQTNENIHAKIRGHVCCADDYSLSNARARVVFDYLIKRNIDPQRLSYKGYSNKMPVIYPEVTEADRIKNRRVDVVFVKQ